MKYLPRWTVHAVGCLFLLLVRLTTSSPPVHAAEDAPRPGGALHGE